MKNKIIAKTLLSVWFELNAYEEMLATRALTHALCSFNTPLQAEVVMNKIIDLNVKRHTIHNLHTALSKIIHQLDPSVQKVIRNYYQNWEATESIGKQAAKLGMSERSYFRKLDYAINYLADRLPSLGINFFTWKYLLDHHAWLKESFNHERQPNRRRNPLRQKE